MIDFEKKEGSPIPPISTEIKLPEKDQVALFFENFCKSDVEQYSIFKKNSFKNLNMDVLKDFLNKLESFIKDENVKNDNKEVINIVFQNIRNNMKVLEFLNMIPNENKNKAFLASFISSRLLS